MLDQLAPAYDGHAIWHRHRPHPHGWTHPQGAAATITAEVAQAHDGSLGTDHAFIDEAARAAKLFQVAGCPLAVLQCTSAYPVAPQEVGLKVMQDFAACYR